MTLKTTKFGVNKLEISLYCMAQSIFSIRGTVECVFVSVKVLTRYEQLV